MPRNGSSAEVKWIEIDPCFVFHPLNTYETDGAIVMDVARYASLWSESPHDFGAAVLTRWTIDLAVPQDLTSQARRFEEVIKPFRLGTLSTSLGISTDSLRRLHVGWSGVRQILSNDSARQRDARMWRVRIDQRASLAQ